ncbi:tetratricopeptide repeat-containing glycosyltransferase family protein [Xanthobacter sp. V4C-4]|uniref:tetratricopeptide repeat protein n=1 Tax=Xanthobacter cornucopiae TaxID=3119924 RepID=UPI00372A5581
MSIDARAAFSRATELHRQGKLDEAIDIYRRLSKAQPVFEVQRLLVFALLQTRRFKDALVVARKTRDAFPSLADAHVLLGAALQAGRTWDKALAAYEAAAVLDPALAEAHYLAGNVLVSLGRHADAVARFDRVLALDPRAAEALANRATALSRIGRSQEALRDCEALTSMQPWDARHWISTAGTLLELSRFEEATAAADQALRLDSHLADAHFMRGQGLLGLGHGAEAGAAFAAAIKAAPDQVAWSGHLARVLRQQGDLDAALDVCDAALARDPSCFSVLQERAEVKRARGELAAALADAEAALALQPDLALGHVSVATLKRDLGDADGAAAALALALAADPDLPLARYMSGSEHLAHGRWDQGWADYESRARMLPPSYVPLAFQRWDGREPVDDLIVLGEQGIGDLIQFGRLVRVLADRGIRARILTHARHAPLLARIDARVPVISDLALVDAGHPRVRWVPLASLPGLIAPDPAHWPGAPYLTADPERVARWRRWRLAEPPPPDPAPEPLEGEASEPEEAAPPLEDPFEPVEERQPRLRIGIAWQGNPSPSVDVGRSVPLAAFAPLAELEDVELVSLQWGHGEEQLDTVPFGARIVRLSADRDAEGTFVDTAGILQHLDVVVTSDSSLVHLAGARGRPAFLALRAVPDWRWGREGERTALYPTVRLFRQQRAGDWDEVFARIAHAVQALLRQKGSA